MQRTRPSMSELLKNTPFRRSREHAPRRDEEDKPEPMERLTPRSTDPEASERVPAHAPGDEAMDTESKIENIFRDRAPRSPRSSPPEPELPRLRNSPSERVKPTSPRISTRSSGNDRMDDSDYDRGEIHRATSRQRASRRYESDEEEEKHPVRVPPRPTGENVRVSSRPAGETRDRDSSEEESEEEREPRIRRHSPQRARQPVQARNFRRNGPRQEDMDDEPLARSPRRPREPESDEEELPPRRSRDYHESDDQRSEPEDVPRRSRGSHRPAPVSSGFSALPKTAIARIAKTEGVHSLSADVYDSVKELSGDFVHKVLGTVAKAGNSIVTSVELEPIVERYLRDDVRDLEHSDINMTTCAKYIRAVADSYSITLKKEATLYLHNATENFIRNLFYHANKVARHARRARVTSRDLEMAQGM